jgi:hypothetical protein
VQIDEAKNYLLRHVGALKNQLPFGDPFVFVGAFTLVNTLGKFFRRENYEVLGGFLGYDSDEAQVINIGAQRLMDRFTLSEVPVRKDLEAVQGRTFRVVCGAGGYITVNSSINMGDYKDHINKLNLSHKDREHLKRKNSELTLSAGAFLEDLEKGINKAFDSVKDDEMEQARLFVAINERPLVGYGD